jgi:hypothetical protein
VKGPNGEEWVSCFIEVGDPFPAGLLVHAAWQTDGRLYLIYTPLP